MPALAVAALIIAGCSGPGTGGSEATNEPPGQASTTPSFTLADLEARDRQLADLAAAGGLTDVPDVEIVRWVRPREHMEALGSCISAAGFSVTNISELGYELSYPQEQASAVRLAEYVCTGQYPVLNTVPNGPSDDYAYALYDYYSGELRSRLEDQGHMIAEPPTRETFLANFGSPTVLMWTPYNELRAADGIDSAEERELQRLCPEMPPFDPY